MRTFKLIGGTLLSTTSLFAIVVNVNSATTWAAVLTAILAIQWTIRVADGAFTGYLECRNKDPETVSHNMRTLFSAARSSIKIVTGRLNPRVYFEPSVFEALRAAIEDRGIAVQVLMAEPDADLARIKTIVTPDQWTRFTEWRKTRNVRVSRTAHRFPRHFIVIDGQHIRLEDPSRSLFGLEIGHSHRAYTTFFAESAPLWAGKFDKLASSAHELTAA